MVATLRCAVLGLALLCILPGTHARTFLPAGRGGGRAFGLAGGGNDFCRFNWAFKMYAYVEVHVRGSASGAIDRAAIGHFAC